MGNLCCQKPEDDLVLETFQSAEKINAINENIIERDLNSPQTFEKSKDQRTYWTNFADGGKDWDVVVI